MKKMRKKLLTWSISSGLLISTALYSSLSLAYRIDKSSEPIQSISKIPIGYSDKLKNIPFESYEILAVETYDKKNKLDEKEVLAQNINESAIHVLPKGELYLVKVYIQKKGKTRSIYESGISGLNSGILNTGNTVIDKGVIKTFGVGAKGYFQKGKSSNGLLVGLIVETNQVDSNGIEVANEGVLKLSNTAINTVDDRSAGLAVSAKAHMNAMKTIVLTNGVSSPGFYNGGRLSLINNDITANSSYIGVIEGANNFISIDSHLKGQKGIKIINHSDNNEINDNDKAIIGFKNGFIDVKEDPVFLVDNMSAIINLNSVELKSRNEKVIYMSSNSKRELIVNLFEQKIAGDIDNDKNSNIEINLANNSIYNGSILNGASINIDKTSKWFVKRDSVIGSLIIPDNNIEKYIVSNGNSVLYDVNKNEWLKGKVIELSDGGSLIPVA